MSWQRAAIDAGAVVAAVISRAAPRADAGEPLGQDQVLVVGEESAPPGVLRDTPPKPEHEEISRRVALLVPEGARLQVGPSPVGDALLRGLTVPVTIDSGLLPDAGGSRAAEFGPPPAPRRTPPATVGFSQKRPLRGGGRRTPHRLQTALAIQAWRIAGTVVATGRNSAGSSARQVPCDLSPPTPPGPVREAGPALRIAGSRLSPRAARLIIG